jgi:hypothetical protein
MIEDQEPRGRLDRRYAAFISYRHVAADRVWAKWLVEALETFRTPRGLVRRGFRARIGLLYRDEDENPASAELGDQIDKALRASDALIVVASRDTPASRWIDREVARFQELGRGDRILVLLTDGEPAEAYPPSLFKDPDREPIAADVRRRRDETQRLLNRRARLRLAAALLGCGFDDLYQRDRKRRRRRWAAAIALLLLLALAGGGALLVAAQARERLRLDRAASRITDIYSMESDRARQGADMFNALRGRDWPYARVPASARALLGGTIRGAAVSRLRFPDEALPITLQPWRSGLLAGLSDGGIYLVSDRSVTPLHRTGCSRADSSFMRCAITALEASGERIVAGTNRGEVMLFDAAGQRMETGLPLSTLRIEAVLALPGGRAIAADAGGTLFAIAGGRSRVIAQGGGSVVSLLREPAGSVLVVRASGLVQRLSPQGLLALVAEYPGPVRAAGLVDGRFYLLKITMGSGTAGMLLEGTPEHAVARNDTTRVFVQDTNEGVFFGYRGTWIAFGRGVGIEMFDLVGRRQEAIGIEAPPMQMESQDIVFGFYGAIAPSGDRRRLYSVDQPGRALLVIDLAALVQINALLANSRTLRSDLCRPERTILFATLGLPRSACD